MTRRRRNNERKRKRLQYQMAYADKQVVRAFIISKEQALGRLVVTVTEETEGEHAGQDAPGEAA